MQSILLAFLTLQMMVLFALQTNPQSYQHYYTRVLQQFLKYWEYKGYQLLELHLEESLAYELIPLNDYYVNEHQRSALTPQQLPYNSLLDSQKTALSDTGLQHLLSAH